MSGRFVAVVGDRNALITRRLDAIDGFGRGPLVAHYGASDMPIVPRALAALDCSGSGTAQVDRISVLDLLRGLIAQNGSVAARALSADGRTDRVLAIVDDVPSVSHSRRTWIDYAADESVRRGQTYVGTEHLLLAALRELLADNPHCADVVRSLRGQTWRTLIDLSPGSLRIPAGPKTALNTVEPAPESLLRPVLSDEPVVGASFATISRDNASNAVVGCADLAANRPVRPDTRFRVGSITKIATTLLVLRLVDEDLLHLDQPANEHLHSLSLRDRHGTTSTATIRQLLTHTAGLPRGSGLRHDDGPVPPIPIAFAEGIQAENDVGTWSYSNLGFVVLAQVTADLLHTSFAGAIHDLVLTPLGLSESVLAPDLPERTPYPRATGYAYDRHSFIPLRDIGVVAQGAGDLVATASDTAKLIAATIHDGYLSERIRAELATPHVRCGDNTWQGLGVRIRQRGHTQLIGHDGNRPGFQSSALACKESGKSAALLANTDTRPLTPYLEELLLTDSS